MTDIEGTAPAVAPAAAPGDGATAEAAPNVTPAPTQAEEAAARQAALLRKLSTAQREGYLELFREVSWGRGGGGRMRISVGAEVAGTMRLHSVRVRPSVVVWGWGVSRKRSSPPRASMYQLAHLT